MRARLLDDRRPAWSVLPLPVPHRLLVALHVPGLRIDAERPSGPLRDVAGVAEQDALRPLRDWLGDRRAGADRLDETRDVQGGELIVAARRQRIRTGLRDRLLHHFVLEVVDGVAVLIEHYRPRRPVHDRAARPVLGRERVAAQALPHDGALALELEAGFLGVGELPIIFEVVPAAGRGDAHRVVHAEGPARDGDFVRAVVAD